MNFTPVSVAFSVSTTIRRMAKSIFLPPSCTPSKKLPIFQLSSRANLKQLNSSRNVHVCLLKYPLASRIMIRNLPYTASESSLLKEFSKYGKVAEVKLAKDEKTNRSKGFAFIQYTSQEDALLAQDNMDHKYFDGRVIFIDLAKPRSNEFGGYPRTSGPPEEQYMPPEDEDEDEE